MKCDEIMNSFSNYLVKSFSLDNYKRRDQFNLLRLKLIKIKVNSFNLE